MKPGSFSSTICNSLMFFLQTGYLIKWFFTSVTQVPREKNPRAKLWHECAICRSKREVCSERDTGNNPNTRNGNVGMERYDFLQIIVHQSETNTAYMERFHDDC